MKRFLLALVFGAVTGGGLDLQAAGKPGDFEYRAALDGATRPGVIRVWLPRGVVSVAARDYSDIRLFDDLSREVPYVIYEDRGATSLRDYFGLKVLAYRDLPEGGQVIVERPDNRPALNGLVFHTANRNFQKLVTVETSADRRNWKEWRRDTIFDFSSRVDLRQTEMALPATPDKYLRLTWRDHAATSATATAGQLHIRYQGLEVALQDKPGTSPFRLEGVSGWLGENLTRESMFDRVIDLVPDKVALNDKGNSVLTADLGNVPLNGVEIDVAAPEYFYRRARVWAVAADKATPDSCVGEGWIYHLPGMAQAQTKIRISGVTTATLLLEIINGDNLPLTIKRVNWLWPLHNLYFFAEEGRSYALHFGAVGMARPDYETARLLSESQVNSSSGQALYPAVQLATVEKNPLYRPPVKPLFNEQSGRWGLIALVLVFGAGLGYWAFSLLKQSSQSR